MLTKCNTIYPMMDAAAKAAAKAEIEAKWVEYHTAVLDTIMDKGDFVIPYKHNRVVRGLQLVNCALCAVVCCCPCMACDFLNGVLYMCCGAHIRHPCDGCFATACEGAMNETYKRTDEKDIEYLRKNMFDIPKQAIKNMCGAYLAKFDECVAHRTVPMAQRANAIREQIVHIISTYLSEYWLLKDTGDIDALRQIVEKM